jgi:hypothetical protein
MKFYYPKFLKVGPKFVGLSIFDLFVLVFALFISLFFNLGSFQSLGLISLLIGMSKVVALRFPRGYFQFYFHKRRSLDWKDDLLKLTNGVFI